MSQKKNIVIGAALAGLSIGLFANSNTATANDNVHCWGVNKCGKDSKAKDKASCSVNEQQVAAAKKEFNEKFSSASVHKCGTHAECAAAKGQLNWTKVKSKEICKKLGGFLMDEEGKIEKL